MSRLRLLASLGILGFVATSIPTDPVFAASSTPPRSGQVLVDWDFTNAENLTTAGTATQVGLGVSVLDSTEATTATGLTCSDITAESRWAGDPCNPAGLYWSGGGYVQFGELNLQRWDGDTSASCGAANDGINDNYLAFTLTGSGAPIEVTRISISLWRNGSGAPAKYAWEVVADGGTPISFGAPQLDPASGDGIFDWFQFDGSVTATSSIEIRFRPAADAGGLGTGNLHIDGLRVETGTAVEPPGPNVLLVLADDLTATALGCYGNPIVQTPNFDSLASRGVRFERAYCQFPVCQQSRESMMAGWYPARISGGFDASLGPHRSLPEHFRLSGYTTARVSKIFHMRIPGDITSGSSGPDHAASWSSTFNVQAPEWMTPGISGHYTNGSLDFSQPTAHYNLGFGTEFYCVESSTDGSEQADYIAAEEAINLLGSLQNVPFFLAVGFVRPHVPLVATATEFGLYDPDTLPLATSVPNDLADVPSAGIFWNEPSRGPNTDSDRQHVLQAYYAAVTFMDEQLGKVLARLDELELTDNTIVVLTSDHGYHLGEHTFWQKLSLHEESARVPLIIAGPGVSAGVTTDALTELIDVYPTLADLAGIGVPPRCQGVSLRPILKGAATSVREAVLSSVSGGHLLRTAQWAYLRYNDGTAELYDMSPSGDPLQFTNLHGNPAYAAVEQQLDSMLDEKLEEASADPAQPFCFGDGNPDPCPCGNESALGAGEGCTNSVGVGAVLRATGTASVVADDLVFHLSQGPPSQVGLLLQSASTRSVPFKDGNICLGNPLLRIQIVLLDGAGAGSTTISIVTKGGVAPGDTRYYQEWYRDPTGACGLFSNLTNALIVDWE